MKKVAFLLFPLLLFAQVAVSIKPLALVVREIYPGKVIVVVPPNRSPHIFSPSPGQVREILKTKALFKIGAGLEPWSIPSAREVELSAAVSLISKKGKPNPHYWLSPKRMLQALDLMEKTLEDAFPELREGIRKRTEREREKLEALDRRVAALLSPVRNRVLILYRPAWLYLVKDYGFPEPEILTSDPSRPPAPSRLGKIKGDLLICDPSLPREKAKVLSRWLKVPFVYLDPLASFKDYSSYNEFILENVTKLVGALR